MLVETVVFPEPPLLFITSMVLAWMIRAVVLDLAGDKGVAKGSGRRITLCLSSGITGHGAAGNSLPRFRQRAKNELSLAISSLRLLFQHLAQAGINLSVPFYQIAQIFTEKVLVQTLARGGPQATTVGSKFIY